MTSEGTARPTGTQPGGTTGSVVAGAADAPPDTLPVPRPAWVTTGYEGEPTIVVLDDAAALAEDAAARVASAIDGAVEERGEAHIALTGGSSAGAFYRTLAMDPWRARIPWDRVHLWWGDERYVPLDHRESCANIAFAILLRQSAGMGFTGSGLGGEGTDVTAGSEPGAPVPAENIHPIPVQEAIGRDLGPEWAAERYAAELRAHVPVNDEQTPLFDVVLLGLGSDGHILSVFPDSPALDEDAPLAMSIPAPTHITPHVPRVTLNPRVVPAARLVIVMIPGDAKAQILSEVLGGERDVRRWPGEAARCSNAVWLADRASAAMLPQPAV